MVVGIVPCEVRELVDENAMILVLCLAGHSSFTFRNLTRENPVLGKIDFEQIHWINTSVEAERSNTYSWLSCI